MKGEHDGEHEWGFKKTRFGEHHKADTQPFRLYRKATNHNIQEAALSGPHYCNVTTATCFVINTENLMGASCIPTCLTTVSASELKVWVADAT